MQFVSCGNKFTLCLDSFGAVWLFGGINFVILWSPTKIPALEEITTTAISARSNILATADNEGNLWIMGIFYIKNIRKVPQFAHITNVACGYNFILCLDEEYHVWGLGNNAKGQLGLGKDVVNTEEPKRIETLEDIVFVDCGNYHSICQNSEGNLFSFGANPFGQLGLGDGDFIGYFVPQKIPFFAEIYQLSCGQNHTMCLDVKGNLWGFGNNGRAQLGLGHATSFQSSPVMLKNVSDILYVACGETHTLWVDSKNHLYGCGSNYQGQLGGGETGNIFKPRKITEHQVECISKGSNHVFFKDFDGNLWGVGDNSMAQLGLGNTRSFDEPQQLSLEFSHLFWSKRSTQKSARK